MTKFKRDEWYPMRGGDERRVIAIDLSGEYPVIAHDKEGHPYTYTQDGHYYTDGTKSLYDLILPQQKPREIWVNEYTNGNLGCFDTREIAEAIPSHMRIGPARLFREVLE